MRPENPSLDLSYFNSLNDSQKLEHLIKFAIFAPSSHNTQPWLFKISPGSISVFVNHKRGLAYSDPTGREMYLSVGAAIENILLVCEYFGFKPSLEFKSQQDLIAEIHFAAIAPKVEQQELVQAVLQRHCNRNEYSDKAVEGSFLEFIRNNAEGVEVAVIDQPEKKKEIVKVLGDSIEQALNDPEFEKELGVWIKPSLQKYKDGMPGYNLGIPYPVSFIFPLMLKNLRLGKFQRKMDEKVFDKSAAFVILATAGDSIKDWLQTGMAFEKISANAQLRNIKVAVQAAPIEMGEYHKQLESIAGVQGRAQMFFKIGYCEKVPQASPRLSLEDVLIK